MTDNTTNDTNSNQNQATNNILEAQPGRYLIELCQRVNGFYKGPDQFGRDCEVHRDKGHTWPSTIILAPTANSTYRLEFTLQTEVDQTHLPVYKSGLQLLDTTYGGVESEREISPGVVQLLVEFPGGSQIIQTASSAGTIKVQLNEMGAIAEKVTQSNTQGWTIVQIYETQGALGQLARVEIVHADGSSVKLQPVKSTAQILWGYRVDAAGKQTDDVTWFAELHRLQYRNLKTNEKRTYKFTVSQEINAFPELVAGKLDPALSTFEYAGLPGETIIESQNGRIDVRSADGSIFWRDPSNQNAFSYALPNGEAAVFNADGSMVRLDPSNHLMLRVKEGFFMQTISQDLSTQMEAMKSFTDRRDWAQLLLKFSNRKSALESFVATLSEFSTCDKLPASRSQALVKTLLHLVEFPAEIYQGRIGSCTVTTIMREVAMTNPARLAGLILSAIATRSVEGADGNTFAIDTANTLAIDASGRDICCKAFQNIALQMVTQMQLFDVYGDGRPRRLLYRDNAVGKGEFVICGESFSLDDGDSGDTCSLTGAVPPTEIVEFPGLDDGLIRDLCTEITGVKHLTQEITTVAELADYSRAAGYGTVIVVVDGEKPPFYLVDETPGQPVTPNHVISVTKVGEDGTVFFMNEWGPPYDHSTAGTGVSGQSFMDNCLIEWSKFEKNAAPGKRARIIVAAATPATDNDLPKPAQVRATDL